MTDLLNENTNKALISMSLPISIGMLSTFLFQVVVKFRSLVKVADEGFVWEPPPETPLELDVSFISGADAIIEDAEKRLKKRLKEGQKK